MRVRPLSRRVRQVVGLSGAVRRDQGPALCARQPERLPARRRVCLRRRRRLSTRHGVRRRSSVPNGLRQRRRLPARAGVLVPNLRGPRRAGRGRTAPRHRRNHVDRRALHAQLGVHVVPALLVRYVRLRVQRAGRLLCRIRVHGAPVRCTGAKRLRPRNLRKRQRQLRRHARWVRRCAPLRRRRTGRSWLPPGPALRRRRRTEPMRRGCVPGRGQLRRSRVRAPVGWLRARSHVRQLPLERVVRGEPLRLHAGGAALRGRRVRHHAGRLWRHGRLRGSLRVPGEVRDHRKHRRPLRVRAEDVCKRTRRWSRRMRHHQRRLRTRARLQRARLSGRPGVRA